MQPHTASPGAVVPSEGTNENYDALSTGEGDVDNNRLQLFRGETMPNFIKTGLVWSTVSGLDGGMTAGTAYVNATFGPSQG